MKEILLYPTYIPSIIQMVAVARAEKIVFEIEDNYQKQTYRNRAYIAHSNGRLLLNIPIKHSKEGRRQKTKEIAVENSFPWQEEHWKSIQTAYRTSPYFEYYEDDLALIFQKKAMHLMEYNMQIFELFHELLGLEIPFESTSEYLKNPPQQDLRYLAIAKREPDYLLAPYTQVLEAHHGFLPNLSILDLLCNEGPNALIYLESQQVTFEIN
ncbi:MAG: WbqC family protein [Flavobacteriaceae bacterium]|nr:WbqC family protein [Flavobacteriaceae bacterium]